MHKCELCENFSKEGGDDVDETIFINLKAYNKTTSQFGSLKTPPKNFNRIFESNISNNISNRPGVTLFELYNSSSILGRRRIHDGDISYQIDNSGFECVLDNSVQSVIMMELSSNMSDIYMNNCCKINYNSLFFDDTISICVETKNSDIEWKKQRQFRITGSRCYAIFTYNKNDWYKKALSYFWPKEFTNKRLEIDIFMKLVVPHNNPWLGFSPDGVIVENNVPIKLFEIKCPFIGKQKPIRDCLENLAYLEKGTWNLKKKHIYFGQVQLGMAILNLFSCDFVLYSSFDESLFIINVPFDEPFCQQMLAKLQQNFF
ncbi:hypothetical protein NQ317_018091 [Molorchus minor]|uniref:YqaJ viral recombinase domain-containing protein n=1 Tax=Molorchus minor TaxID=1323400 RepID=A0ABQ9JDY5_9CUCU|nr:hypothetical protein NQ317_018091 [Molorchus minor]